MRRARARGLAEGLSGKGAWRGAWRAGRRAARRRRGRPGGGSPAQPGGAEVRALPSRFQCWVFSARSRLFIFLLAGVVTLPAPWGGPCSRGLPQRHVLPEPLVRPQRSASLDGSRSPFPAESPELLTL